MRIVYLLSGLALRGNGVSFPNLVQLRIAHLNLPNSAVN